MALELFEFLEQYVDCLVNWESENLNPFKMRS